jgi:hypothetical protein
VSIDRLDHLVYAAPDLVVGIDRTTALLGVRPSPGGQHRGRGTRNALVSLGPRTYLEIVGPDPDQPPPPRPRWFSIDLLTAPRLMTWASAAGDIEARASRARRAGLDLGPVLQGGRTSADGVELAWRFTDPETDRCGGVVPFLIDWGSSPHPAVTAVEGGTLLDLRAEHPDPGFVVRCLQALGLDLHITRAIAPALVATIQTARGVVELR